MRFKIQVEDTEDGFSVHVLTEAGVKVQSFTWYGGFFTYEGRQYVVRGPYDGDIPFQVFELIAVSDPA